jgi:hypothetical protein
MSQLLGTPLGDLVVARAASGRSRSIRIIGATGRVISVKLL